ncbi:hypothetical protein Y032_0078g1196 [Ancylostoma ceylanicum]|uniref:Uncharacterized protein n=1 Tax=Ancylostoma ceylanicum TaxID=53326 RepID=A0A016TUR0_9BILA|nr:hypothetical protein Y032_0078g1196 [Ancylostoma ceylanicum]
MEPRPTRDITSTSRLQHFNFGALVRDVLLSKRSIGATLDTDQLFLPAVTQFFNEKVPFSRDVDTRTGNSSYGAWVFYEKPEKDSTRREKNSSLGLGISHRFILGCYVK